MATLIGNNKPSMMAFPSALNRMGTFPIDISSVWYSYDEAVAYATQTNFTPKYEGQTGLPYVGQILTVVETAEDGTTSVTAYSIQNEAGELAQVGTVTLGDNATIVRDEETGALSLYGIDELTWKETVKDAEGNETEKDVTTYQPKLIKKDGKVVLTWEIPSTITVEGLSTRIQTAEGNIEQLGKDIDAVEKDLTDNYYNKEAIDGIEDNLEKAIDDAIDGLSNTYYNKEEVDAKITSVLKFQGVKTYKSELPTTEQRVGDVWLVIYDGDAPAEGETNIHPVANIEYVWTTENKWEPLGDDIIDLTNYYTKGEVNVELAKKGAVNKVEDGTENWAVKVTDAEGNVTHAKAKVANASNEAFGLVKGDGTNVSIADGVITVNEAGHAAEATHATNADNATNATNAAEATHATNADNATNAGVADEAKKVQHTITVLSEVFDGSANVEITTDEVKTAVGIANYYTKSEADNNFMTETETNDAITAVTDPIKEDIAEIIGDVPEEEGYVVPNLVNIGERLDAHDEALEGLEGQVETANNTANAANQTASDAKGIAEDAQLAANAASGAAERAESAANSAVDTAGSAKDAADGAVETANSAKQESAAALSKSSEALNTANTAKGTADEAKAAAGVNAAAITALQTKDTEFTASINALNEADSKHTTDIAKNAADIAGHTGTLTSYGERLGTVEGKVSTLEGTITGLEGAMHFVGETEVDPEGNNPVTIEGIENYQPKAGDVVLYDGLEFVYSKASTWVKFGDEGSYLTKTAADTNFLKKEDAATTYAPKSGFETLRDVTVPAAAKTAEWASVSGKPNLSYVEAKETTFSSTTTLTAEEGKIRNIEVYDADGERVILDIKRTSDLSYTLTAVGSTETLTVTYEVIHTVA